MNKLLIFISVIFMYSCAQASLFTPRAGEKLNFDVIQYLNSDDQLAKDAISYILNYFNGTFDCQAQALLSFTPDLALHKAECRQHWNNQKIYYNYELQNKGSVCAQGDPLFPPIYMQDKDQVCTATINGDPKTAREIPVPRRVDIDKYVISYVINIVSQESIPQETKLIEVHCNPHDSSIKVPITLKEIDSCKWVRPWSDYYPYQKEEIELHEGMLSKPNRCKEQVSQLEPISVQELLGMVGKNQHENSTIFLKLVSASFLDSNFDRFPREAFFIKCVLSAATKKEDCLSDEASPQKKPFEQSWIVKKIYHYKYPLFVLLCGGLACVSWYFSKKANVGQF